VRTQHPRCAQDIYQGRLSASCNLIILPQRAHRSIKRAQLALRVRARDCLDGATGARRAHTHQKFMHSPIDSPAVDDLPRATINE
jgi:hypothetical protein